MPRKTRILLLLGVWTLVGVFFGSQSLLFSYRLGRPMTLVRAFVPEIIYCYWAALFTPLIFYIASRIRFEKGRILLSGLLHVSFSLLFATIWLSVPPFLISAVGIKLSDRPISLMTNLILNVDRGVMVYWVVLLIHLAYDYHHRFVENAVKASRLETQLVQAQLQSLKMQLHPHFLFNTLNSISTLVLKSPNDAHTMIARLGDFLRLTLHNINSHQVTLRQELAFLESYLKIEQIRFRDRLSVIYNIDPETQDLLLPNLLLQPLVENSIKYAIAAKAESGHISIASSLLNHRLRIEVSDDGPGVVVMETGRGIGLTNIRDRLRQLYGDNYRLDFHNSPECGFTVILEIPSSRTLRFSNEDSGRYC